MENDVDGQVFEKIQHDYPVFLELIVKNSLLSENHPYSSLLKSASFEILWRFTESEKAVDWYISGVDKNIYLS